ncbi:hypothetical protein GR217_34285 [Rhizobium leguminosarum]|uniref:Uncharacterized protein n=1 Tax=Rhizobium ruizarguesonis TaxID=2081791 RepID=A0AAE4YXC5_9HYPH|nr:hypothetical protein [Rhizobium ruizarguesonis]NEI52689.1 hypothetical protein [Rhizobium ruizarguesonis]
MRDNAKTFAWKQTTSDASGIFNAAWIIEAPFAHPFWHQYALFLYDLTTPRPGDPPLNLHLPGATHEMLLYALDPDHPIERDAHLTPEKIRRLEPANYGYQFKADSDDVAEARMQAIVDGIVAREINPDTDWRGSWDNALFPDAYALVRSDFWG